MSQTMIEIEFKGFMKLVYPTLSPTEMQYKASRLVFYAGAITMMSSTGVVDAGLEYDMGVAYTAARNRESPEEALHELVRGRE